MTLHGKIKLLKRRAFFPDAGAFRTWGQKTNKRIPSNGGQRRATAFLPPVPSPALSGRLAVHAEFFIPGFQLEGEANPKQSWKPQQPHRFPCSGPLSSTTPFLLPRARAKHTEYGFPGISAQSPGNCIICKNCLFFLVEHAPAAATSYFSASLRSREPLPTVRTVF